MTEIESFKILEVKVNELIKRCVFLQEENKSLKESLQKTEHDMYSLIESQDELKNKNQELNEKLLSITNDPIVKNIIHNIDEIMGYSEKDYPKPLNNNELNINVNNEEKHTNTPTSQVNTVPQNATHTQIERDNSYNYGINIPTKTEPNQSTEIKNEQKSEQRPGNTEKIIHIDENEDPFSSATDESWDNEINSEKSKIQIKVASEQQEAVIKEVKKEAKQDFVKEEEDSFEFSIDDDDEYIFGDDEESGFAFDEKK